MVKLKYVLLATSLLLSTSAAAQDADRNVAGKLTSYKKPHVLVVKDIQSDSVIQSSMAVNLANNPDEIICRKERVGSYGSSRIKMQRCRTRAEIRELNQRERALRGGSQRKMRRVVSTVRIAGQLRDREIENRNVIRRIR